MSYQSEVSNAAEVGAVEEGGQNMDPFGKDKICLVVSFCESCFCSLKACMCLA